MKTINILLSFVILSLLQQELLLSQWRKLDFPNRGRVWNIFSTENALLARTEKHIYQSDKPNIYWRPLESAMDLQQDHNVISLRSHIWMYDGTDIYHSSDNGTRWERLTTLTANKPWSLVFADSALGVFISTDDGLYRSTTFGNSWKLAKKIQGVTDMALNDTTLYIAAGPLYAASRKIEDTIQVLRQIGDSLQTTNIVILRFGSDSTILLANKWISAWFDSYPVLARFQTSDSLWLPLPADTPTNIVQSGTVIYGTMNDTVVFSTDCGMSWKKKSRNFLGSLNKLTADDDKLYAATTSGVYAMSISDSLWSDVTTGIMESVIHTIRIYTGNGQTFPLFTGNDYISFPSAPQFANGSFSFSSLEILPPQKSVNLPTIVVGTNDGILLSDGINWTRPNSGPVNSEITTLCRIDSLSAGELISSSILAGTYKYANYAVTGGIYSSSDLGLTWIPSGLSGYPINQLVSSGKSGLPVIAVIAGNPDRMFISTDNGVNWRQMNTSSVTHLRDAVGIDTLHGNIHFGILHSKISDPEKWITGGAGLPLWKINAYAFSKEFIFAACGEGIYVSINDGMSWRNISTGLPKVEILALNIHADRFLYAGTSGSGIWSRSWNDIVSEVTKDIAGLPETFSLSQNYPNPFNPSTVISYQLPVNSMVSLKIYDLLGREIATLVNEEQSAGWKEVEWNASAFSSGIYFYKLQTGEFLETKRMILMK